MKLRTPHKFKERILLFGGGGVGKTTAVCSIAAHLADGKMWVIDNDYSLAYERALATDFTEAEERVEVIEVDADWEECVAAIERVIAEGDPEHDWLVIDPFSPLWQYVQTWMSRRVHGADIDEYMIDLRAESSDRKEFAKSLGESMNWPIVDRVWTERVLKNLRKWKGHLVLVCEATETSTKFDDEDTKDLFGHLGVKPAGQKRSHHIASTNLLLTKIGHGKYAMTTAKDRNREELTRAEVTDFGLDYLRDVAGWERVKSSGD
jgi:hypothetical protein